MYATGVRNPTFVRFGFALCLSLSAVFLSTPAFADKATETQAKALQKKAMDEDYLATDFTKAQDKLNKAITMCGADKCSAAVRAGLKRDLGVVDIGGQVDKDAGMAAFVDAIKLDSTIALDPDLKTKELEAAFDAAKKKAGGGKTTPDAGNTGEEPSGDFNHSPVLEQAVRTPVPIYAEYTGSEPLVRVIAKYKAFGMTEFKQLELKKTGNGWGATVPCTDVLQGALQYYLQGFNAQSDPVATGGDRNHTYTVQIKSKIEGDAPHLPDQPPPTQCADTSDCPPGFPCANKSGGGSGNEATGGTKLEGEDCEDNSECKSNECKTEKCTAPADDSTKFPRVWIGVTGAFDFSFISSDNDVCALDSGGLPFNTSGYYCTTSDGTNYPKRSYDNDPTGAENGLITGRDSNGKPTTNGHAGSVNGGTVIGNVRVNLAFDYAVTRNALVGARLGLVLGRYPGSAYGSDGGTTLPVQFEGRFTYLFLPGGVTALVNPYAFVAVGASEYDGEVDVPVTETGSAPKNVQAWKVAGPLYGGVGGGIRIAFPLGQAKKQYMAVMVAPKLIYAVGNGGLFNIEPEAGIQLGF